MAHNMGLLGQLFAYYSIAPRIPPGRLERDKAREVEGSMGRWVDGSMEKKKLRCGHVTAKVRREERREKREERREKRKARRDKGEERRDNKEDE